MDKYIGISLQNLWEALGKDIHGENELTVQGSAIINGNRIDKHSTGTGPKRRITLSVHTGVVRT